MAQPMATFTTRPTSIRLSVRGSSFNPRSLKGPSMRRSPGNRWRRMQQHTDFVAGDESDLIESSEQRNKLPDVVMTVDNFDDHRQILGKHDRCSMHSSGSAVAQRP